MKNIYLFIGLLLTSIAQAQILKVESGTDLTIMAGTIFKAEDLILTPSANFVITNNTLNKSATVIHSSTNPYAARVYQFTNNTDPFTGSVQIYYNDGAELNGIPEGSLALNVNNGTSWIFYPTATRDGSNNFIFTDGLNAVTLNELTLSDLSDPLPLIWLSFTATKQNKTALLKWITAQERNTRNFTVQHSSDGINWTAIVTLPAAGNSSSTSYYSYLHTAPVTGVNYYRILQTDTDNRNNYSDLRVLRFNGTDETFTITGNPVTNDLLTVQVHGASTLSLYSTDGKLLWEEQVNAGTKSIDVSRYAKGTYLLKSNSSTQKVVIQ